MPQDLPGSQGFLSGFTSGLVHTILGKQKQEEDQFHELKQQRAKMVAQLAEHSRQEDLPTLMQGLDGIIAAKTPDKANAAFGDILGKFITERYAQEEQAIATNEQNSQIASGQQAQYAADSAAGGSAIGTYSDGTVARGPVMEPDAKPIAVNPNAYAKDKVRMLSDEGNQRRAVKAYSQKQAALYDEKATFEEKRQEELRETNRQKIEQTALAKGAQKLGWTEDGEGNAVLAYKDEKGKIQTQAFPGMKLPSSVTQEMRSATAVKVAGMKITADKEEWNAKLIEEKRVNDQKIEESKAKVKEYETKITSGYYNKTNNTKAVANIVARAKVQTSGVDSQLDGITSQINRIMGLDEAIVPWKEKQARLEPLIIEQDKLRRYRAALENVMEVEILGLTEDEKKGVIKESSSKNALSGGGKETFATDTTKNKKPTLTKDSVLSIFSPKK